MGRVYLFLEIITVSFAVAAVWFWFRSSQSFAPEISVDSIENVRLWLDHTAWLNRAAAMCTWSGKHMSSKRKIAGGSSWLGGRFCKRIRDAQKGAGGAPVEVRATAAARKGTNMTDFVATGHAVRTRSPAAFGGSFATIRTRLVDAGLS